MDKKSNFDDDDDDDDDVNKCRNSNKGGSNVSLHYTLKGKSAEAWQVSGRRKCNGLFEVKR